jgi:cation-transporting ATPase E
VHGELPQSGTPAQQIALIPVGCVVLRESVRPEAEETLRFFADQAVRVIIMSGDNPLTVSALAHKLGIANEAVDASELHDDNALGDALIHSTAFGRVRPEQKRDAVRLLQEQGHTVAMTGDGVNDAMAIKIADLGIAMGNATGATKAVSRLVLLDNRFDRLPRVLGLGRRVIANVERVSNIFLSKTVYGILLAVIATITLWPFPFLPRQLSVVSTLAIGIPSFILALAPNDRLYQPGMLRRVTLFSIPSGIIIVLTCVSAFGLVRNLGPLTEARSITTVALFIVSLWLLSVLTRPLTLGRFLLVLSMGLAFILVCVLPVTSDFFALELVPNAALVIGIAIGVGGAVLIELWYRVARYLGLVHDRLVVSSKLR